MLHYVKSHKYERYFLHSFNQSILLFSFSSIDRWHFSSCYWKIHIYTCCSCSSFEHNMPKIPFLTNKHQEKVTAGTYKCQMFWKCSELVAADCPTRAVSWVGAWWFLSSVRLTHALVRRCFSVSPAKFASSSFALILLSLLLSHDSFLIFLGLGPLLGSIASSSQLSSDKI